MGSNKVENDGTNKVSVYSDGSGNTFDSDGGWGYRIIVNGAILIEANGYAAKATNNTMELQAAIEGLKYVQNNLQHLLPYEVELVSDSQLVLGYATGAYQCKALHLTALYIELKKAFKAVGATTRWVKGHAGDEHNDGCDRLAKAARNGKGLTGISTPAVLGSSSGNKETDGDGEQT